TRTASSASSEAKMPGNSLRIATVIVFIFGWRSIHSVATGPVRSTRRNSLTCLALSSVASPGSSCDCGVLAIAQQTAQDLAGCRLGTTPQDEAAPCPFKARETGRGQTDGVQRLDLQRGILCAHDRADPLADPLIGPAHHRHVADIGMP